MKKHYWSERRGEWVRHGEAGTGRDCDIVCDRHEGCRGKVQDVIVSGPHLTPGKFNYCEAATEDDRRAGFTVEIIEPANT